MFKLITDYFYLLDIAIFLINVLILVKDKRLLNYSYTKHLVHRCEAKNGHKYTINDQLKIRIPKKYIYNLMIYSLNLILLNNLHPDVHMAVL